MQSQHVFSKISVKQLLLFVALLCAFSMLNGLLSAPKAGAVPSNITTVSEYANWARNQGDKCDAITKGPSSGYAGLVVIYGIKKYGESKITAIKSNQHPIEAHVSTKLPTKSPPGNVVQLGSGYEGVSKRVKAKNFPQTGGGGCSGATVLKGTGSGNWALDCDLHGGRKNPQPFTVQGQGTPSGAEPGGYWTTDRVDPANGTTHIAVTVYVELPSKKWQLTPYSIASPSTLKVSEKDKVNIYHKVHRGGDDTTSGTNSTVTARAVLIRDGKIIRPTNGSSEGNQYRTYKKWNILHNNKTSPVGSPGLDFDSKNAKDEDKSYGGGATLKSNPSPIKSWNVQPGDKYCEWIRAQARSSENSGHIGSDRACVTFKADSDWEVVPKLTGSTTVTVSTSEVTNKTAVLNKVKAKKVLHRTIKNNGKVTAPNGRHKTTVKFRAYDKSSRYSGSKSNWSNYRDRVTNWSTSLSSSQSKVVAPAMGNHYATDGPVDQLFRNGGIQTGDKICEILTTNPASSDGTPSSHDSAEPCLTFYVMHPGWGTQSEQKITRQNTADAGTNKRPDGTVGSSLEGDTKYQAWVNESYILGHRLTNTGPDPTDKPITTEAVASGFSESKARPFSRKVSGPISISPGVISDGVVWSRNSNPIKINANDAGKESCTQISRAPTSKHNNNKTYSGASCVEVPYYYELKPSVNISKDVIYQGDPIESKDTQIVNPASSKDGEYDRFHTKSKNTECDIEFKTISPEGVESAVGRKNCGTISPIDNGNSKDLGNSVIINGAATSGYSLGTQACIQLVLSDFNGKGQAKTSGWKCGVIAKAPKVQFHNGGVKAGVPMDGAGVGAEGIISTSKSPSWAPSSNRNMYGSWIEYDVFASGKISGFGSAATPFGMGDDVKGESLMFANHPELGHFGILPAQTSYFSTDAQAQFTEQATEVNATKDLDDMGPAGANKRAGHYYTTGNINLARGAPLTGLNQDIVLLAKGNVTISHNIEYKDEYTNLSSLPRIKIIADTITIDPNVTRIDAWLVAKKLVTCGHPAAANAAANAADAASYITTCNKPLLINGQITVGKLGLYRTHGADSTLPPVQNEQAAEVFNLRPDQIISNYLRESGAANNKIYTVFEKSLPPRY